MKDSPKLTEKIEEIADSLEAFTEGAGKKVASLEDRLGMLEARDDRPMMGKADDRSEVKMAIERFFRTGDKTGLAGYDEKAMSIGTDTAGGYTPHS